jgi:hypothetical protein
MVQVRSHWRQRQNVVAVITFASVSTLLLLQNGHMVGRVTTSLPRDSNIFRSSAAQSIVDGPVGAASAG